MATELSVYQQIVRMPGGVHIMATAYLGKTHDHLRDAHGVSPTPRGDFGWKRRNAAAHVQAHRDTV